MAQSTGPPVTWGEPPRGGRLGAALAGLSRRLRASIGRSVAERPSSLGPLPLALRRGELAANYLAAELSSDHPAAALAADSALERAVGEEAWWPADIWGHRALWHYERAGMELEAVRGARLIGDVRAAGGDPASARRYYAEAISEARDIGAEHEEGLAALGMGRAEMQLRNVTTARRLGQIAVDLLERCRAPAAELASARELRGEEKEV
jgi:hypothetical protein